MDDSAASARGGAATASAPVVGPELDRLLSLVRQYEGALSDDEIDADTALKANEHAVEEFGIRLAGMGPELLAAALFRSPAEVLESAARSADEHPPIWDGYLVPGLVTLLNSRFKGGKSTIVWALVDALGAGAESFCGRALPGHSVGTIFLTEEPDTTLADKLPPLAERWNVRILNRATLPTPRPSWAESIDLAIAEAQRTGAELVVVDTFAEWARLAGSTENETGPVQQAVEELRAATDAGLAVLILHHFKKGWQAVLDDGEAGRGASALAGAANVIVDLAEVEGGDARDRQLLASSHLRSTPDALVVRWLGDDGYTVVSQGERLSARRRAKQERVIDTLPISPPGMTVQELADLLEVGRAAAQKLAKAAFDQRREVERTKGANGEHRYWKVPE